MRRPPFSWDDPTVTITPPVAERRPRELVHHGDTRIDELAWLRDREDPAVLDHLRAESAFAESAMAHLSQLRQQLFDEIRSRIVETDVSAPVRHGPWWYFTRTIEGQSYPMHCRLPARHDDPAAGAPVTTEGPPALSGDSPADGGGGAPPFGGGRGWGPGREGEAAASTAEQVLLDENLLAEGHAYLDVANLSVSPGHNLLAYAVDTTGDERFVLHLRDLATGSDLPDDIPGTSYGVAWSNDETCIYYTRPDAANRPYQLWRHGVGTSQGSDTLIVEESDERFHLGVHRTKDGAFVVVAMRSKITTEIHVLDASGTDAPLRLVAPRRQGIELELDHHLGTFLLLTNENAEDFHLLAAAVPEAHVTWTELIPHRPGIRLEGVEVFDRYLACYERVDGTPRIRVHHIAGAGDLREPLGGGWLVDCPEMPSASWGGPNPEHDSAVLRYGYSSLVTPRSDYDLDLDTRQAVQRKRQPVLGGYDPAGFLTERLWTEAGDGVKVPISVVRRRDVPLDGTAPCLLYGYGAYEISIDPVFSSLRLSLLERGFVFAIAHVRGGGELGRAWYEDGKALAKPHTFTDFLACARHLVAEGYTSPERLVARGGSAGGMLMGAIANLAPELFRGIVAEVPFVDCLTTMLDPSLPLTAIEWEEWGDPLSDPGIYAAMKAYSPYDNVRPQHYPDMLVTTGLEDPRVGFWEPAKWVQRLREASPGSRVLLKVETEAGHAGPSGRYSSWREEAFVLAWILDEVGLAGSN